MSVRAAIRAKVTAARLEAASDKRDALTKAARTYFGFACSLIDPPAAAPHRGRRAVRHRQVGAGARARARLSARAREPCICAPTSSARSLFGAAETERLPAEAYSAQAGARVYAALYDKARRIIAAGHSVDRRCGLRAAPRSARGSRRSPPRRAYASTGCFSSPILPRGWRASAARRNDASDAEANVVAQQQYYELGEIDWTEVDASGTPDDTLASARAAIESGPVR